MAEPRVCIDKANELPPGMADRLALEKSKLWVAPGTPPGPEPLPLRVGFFDGDSGLQKAVREVADEWTKHAYIRFAYGAPVHACDVRITFRADPGSWSFLGQDCRAIAKDQPTMNYGWLTEESSQDEIRRVVLHEFGHALGCLHEHCHPEAGIPWDREKVYEFYKRTQGWERADVDNNLFSRYDKTLTVYSRFDEKSIMLYPIDPRLTVNGYGVGWNTELSETDKAFIAEVYPRPAQP
jgi:serralysin